MHFRRLASIVLGGWLAVSAFLLALTSYDVRAIEPLIRMPSKAAAETLTRMQEYDARALMQYHADEVSRWAWGTWEVTQIVLALVVLLSLFLSSGGKRYGMLFCVVMLAVVAFQHWMLSPQIGRLAPSAVFARPQQVSVERDRMASMQSAYKIMEAGKLGVGLLLAWTLLRRGRRRSSEAD